MIALAVAAAAVYLVAQFLAGEPREGAGVCDECRGWHVPGRCEEPPGLGEL